MTSPGPTPPIAGGLSSALPVPSGAHAVPLVSWPTPARPVPSPPRMMPDLSGVTGAERLHVLWDPATPLGRRIGNAGPLGGPYGAERLRTWILPAMFGKGPRRGGGASNSSDGGDVSAVQRVRRQDDVVAPLSILHQATQGTEVPYDEIPRVAKAAYGIVAAAADAGHLQFKKRYQGRPNKFWAALQLLSMKIPKSIVENRCLDWRPRAGSGKLLRLYADLLKQPGVREAMAVIDRIGLRVFLQLRGLLTEENADELATAEGVIDGARHFDPTPLYWTDGAR